MKLTILNKVVDSNKEQAYFAKNKTLGFDVIVLYKNTNIFEGKYKKMYNVTEVHNLYETPIGKRIALESDIHHTGMTIDINDIEEVIVRDAENMSIGF